MDYALAGGVILSGLTIVFVVLIFLTLVVWALGKVLGGSGRKTEAGGKPVAEAPAVPASPAVVAGPVVEDGISNETVAVISASVAAVLGAGCVVRGVKRAQGQRGKGRRTAWGMAGMQQNTSPF